jgi:DNA-binding transcriptional LysR family regulator
VDEYEMLSPNPELLDRILDFRPVFRSDDYSMPVATCQTGVGAMVLLKTPHRLELPGEIVELMPEAPPRSGPPLAIICHKRLVDLPKVRIIVILLRLEFAKLREGLAAA